MSSMSLMGVFKDFFLGLQDKNPPYFPLRDLFQVFFLIHESIEFKYRKCFIFNEFATLVKQFYKYNIYICKNKISDLP